jgi:hypothetical protein
VRERVGVRVSENESKPRSVKLILQITLRSYEAVKPMAEPRGEVGVEIKELE